MGQLEAMGIQVKRMFMTSRCSLREREVSRTETTQLKLVLPQASAVMARFTKAGASKKVAKLSPAWQTAIGEKPVKLWKTELQTGDAAFDTAIHIETDTPDATKTFLASDRVRKVITRLVKTAGEVMIDGVNVTLHVFGHQHGDDANATALAEALLGKQQPTA